MAEILGAVASGLAVAEVGLKVGGTVWKLKKLWQEVHEVPATIRDLMRQIEMMEPILADHEASLGIQGTALPARLSAYSGAPTTQSAVHCREALNDLQRLVEDLDVAVDSEKRSRRTFARMRVVLKKHTIKGFQDRLERATRLLQLAQVSYLTANAAITGAMMTDVWTAVTGIQEQQQRMMQQLSNSDPPSEPGSPPFPVVTKHVGTSPTRDRRKNTTRLGNRIFPPSPNSSIFGTLVITKSETDSGNEETYSACIQLPKWLSQKVWDISISRACSGWQGTIYTWNIVPYGSPSIFCAQTGDLDGLIDLFNRGLASPRDCDPSGSTLLAVRSMMTLVEISTMTDQIKEACHYSQTRIVNHFINMNTDMAQMISKDVWATTYICTSNMPMDIIRQLSSQGFLDFAVDGAEELFADPMSLWMNEIISLDCLALATQMPELFEFYLQTCFPFWHDTPPSWKHKILEMTVGLNSPFTADALQQLICPGGHIRPIDLQEWIEDGCSLLRLVLFVYLKFCSDDGAGDWDSLLEETIKATDDLHHMVEPPYPSIDSTRSAFESATRWILEEYFNIRIFSPLNLTPRRWLKKFRVNLQSLMSIIAGCGHDISKFGRKEAVIWSRSDDNDRTVGDALYLGIRYDGIGLIRALHYGAKPEDWYLETDYLYEEYAGPFWHFIENPHLFMVPGAWIDEE